MRSDTSTAAGPLNPRFERAGGRLWWGVLALIGVACAGSLLLSLEHLGGIGLPGCGVGSPCARAAAGPWGKLPGLGWPVSYAGLAFFSGLAGAWCAHGMGRPPGALVRGAVRIGAVGSVFFLVVSIGDRLWCPYCMAVQAANLGAWVLMERMGAGSAGRGWRGAIALLLIGAAVTGLLVPADARARRAAAQRAEQRLEGTTAALREGRAGTGGAFAGRYRLGPENAAVRLVIFTDYQCPDCRAVEERVSVLAGSRADVSVSIKHFPFCTECNAHAGRDLHPNACWGARAAESAGALGGSAGFWRMHRWLFARGGAFTDAELRAALPSLGFEPAAFVAEMTSGRTLDIVRGDIEEAIGVGLNMTPMIFVNGVELKGWEVAGALERAADAAARAPAPSGDRPPDALARLVGAWEGQAPVVMAPAARAWRQGATDARVRIVLFGDYQEPNCAAADALLRRLAGARGDASYQFRHFPLDASCNPAARSNLHPMACRMARAAESAGAAGGERAFWAAHAWVFEHQRTYSDGSLRGVLEGLGVKGEVLSAAGSMPEIGARIEADCRAAQALGANGVPWIYVNERRVPTWTYEDLPVMERILERAAEMP